MKPWQAQSVVTFVLLSGAACSEARPTVGPSSPDAAPSSGPVDAEATAGPSDSAAPPSPVDSRAAATGGYVDPLLANSESASAPDRPGVQYSGAVALRSTTIVTAAPTGGSGDAWLELSAPILPKVMQLYAGQGANYPTTPQARAQLAHDSALTFTTLLAECQPLYPGIVLWQVGDPPLSDAQVATNYRLLEECAYREYLAKPYWIPQLIQDVEICRQELGPGWRMITEDDVLALSAPDARRIQETLAGVQSSDSTDPGSFLFSLAVWVLRNDGSISGANLQPDASPSFIPLSSSNGMPFDPRVHYEGSLALRCLRVTAGS